MAKALKRTKSTSRQKVKWVKKPIERSKDDLRPKQLDEALFGAYPGLSDWAIPLLEELRNE